MLEPENIPRAATSEGGPPEADLQGRRRRAEAFARREVREENLANLLGELLTPRPEPRRGFVQRIRRWLGRNSPRP